MEASHERLKNDTCGLFILFQGMLKCGIRMPICDSNHEGRMGRLMLIISSSAVSE